MKIGSESSIGLHCKFSAPWYLQIGNNVAINQGVYIDSRGGVTIGNNVNIGRSVFIYTGSHLYNKPKFDYVRKPVCIEDNTWIASNAVILPGVTVSEGAVIGAGSVVTSSVPKYTLSAGNPAKNIKKRITDLQYKTKYFQFLY